MVISLIGSPSTWRALRNNASIVWLIARRELIDNTRNLKIPVSLIAMTLLFLLSSYVLATDYQLRMENWAINQIVRKELALGGGVRYELRDGSFTTTVGVAPDSPVQPPSRLSVLVRGMDREVDRPVTVGQRVVFGPHQDENRFSALFDAPDTAFVVKILVSLCALLLSLGSVALEKESGTLRAVLAHPLGRREFLIGKATGACCSLFIAFAVAYLVQISYLSAGQGLLKDRKELLAALLIFGLSLLYGFVFIFLALFISTVTTQAKTAVVIALLTWGALVLVLPNTSVLAANILSPATSYAHLKARLYRAEQQITQAELSDQRGAESIFDLPDPKQAVLRTIEADIELTDEFMSAKLREVDRARCFGVLSPIGALEFGASDLAGTGASAYKSYMEFIRFGRNMMIDAIGGQWELPPVERRKLLQEARQAVVSRQRQPEPVGTRIKAAIPAFLSLLAWASGFALAAYWRFGRYDVR